MPVAPPDSDPSGRGLPTEAVDLGFRVAYRVAHRLLRAWWSVRNPQTHGALVALWHEGQVLLVKNSYRRQYTLPGGYIRHGESVSEAAARELAEEVGIEVSAAGVREAYNAVHEFEHRRDRVTILELEVADCPAPVVDNREVVWAGFRSTADALAMPLVPHLREYLRDRDAGS